MSRRQVGPRPATPNRGPGQRRRTGGYALPAAGLTLAFAIAACNGSIEGGPAGSSAGNTPGGSGSNPGSGNNSPSGSNTPVTDPSTGATLPPVGANPLEPARDNPACKNITPGPAPIRRLTRTEYDNTVRDLLGEDKQLAKDFPLEELDDSFDNSAQLRSVSDVLAEKYTSAAEAIGKAVVGKLDSIVGCDAAKDGDDACLGKFFDGFGKRLWRRPLEANEKDDLKKVFAANKGASFAEGIDAVVQVMTLSPQFLYRLERGVPVQGSDYQRLTHWEMASRLSYLLWGTLPDPELFSAAEAGKLGTREEVAAQAKRLLDDPRSTVMVTNFAGQWLHLRELADADKDTTVYPQWKDEYLTLFRQETENFVGLVWKGDAKLDTLLSAPFTAMNGPLAAFYGVKNVSGDAFTKVDVDPTQRAGVLTHASIMAAKAGPDQSSPILRGVFVREQMFCQELPPVPANLNAMPPVLNPKMTTKERFAAHRSDPSCEACHKLIDYVGFGFEKYDATGAYRTMENGKTVDATGELINTDIDGKFDGAIELSKKLVTSPTVEACVATHWFNFGMGRKAIDADKCTTDTLQATFTKSGGDMRQLLMAMVQTDAFFFKGGLQ
jgi:hypothetical protein